MYCPRTTFGIPHENPGHYLWFVIGHCLKGVRSLEAPEPVGRDWTVQDPSLPANLDADFSEWSLLVRSAVKVFEHVSQNGASVSLSELEEVPSTVIRSALFDRDEVQPRKLRGQIIDANAQVWRMVAAMEPDKVSHRGWVRFMGPPKWDDDRPPSIQEPRRQGTRRGIRVYLYDDPSDPHSATVSIWDGGFGASLLRAE